MSLIIDYSHQVPESYRNDWDNVTTGLEVKDDLGNIYKGNGNGGSGNIDTGIMNWSKTFSKIDENATKLIITPKIHCSTMKGGVLFDENGEETEIKLPKNKEDKEMVLPDIIVELE